MSKLILVDMDGILVDLMGPWISEYNRIWNDDLSLERMQSYKIKDYTKPECGGRVWNIIQKDPEFFDKLKPLPGAIEGFKELKKRGHEMVILTAPANDHSARAKIRWCQNYLKLRPQDVIVASRKYLVNGDVLIDDSLSKLLPWKEARPQSMAVAIAYPYNRELEGKVDVYAKDYKDTEKAWEQILSKVA